MLQALKPFAKLISVATITCSVLLLSTNANADQQALIHSSQQVIQGEITFKPSQAKAPLSSHDWVIVETQNCATLEFQASMNGLVCRNCDEIKQLKPHCQLPDDSSGWKLISHNS